ncbi:stalk domain-containing protein [Tissierella pigra]|uniref:Copper amine oxidase-like N-terminal domain-containing protein n=1 Tax=Tissierella pigra TaxID=2607614 RepID=A0A6N7Y0E4_9FIRM|nr:stalk domain-containing protein [Tissierella pigra]MSU02334.1 hypothetical protein [Tissierella pigra]
MNKRILAVVLVLVLMLSMATTSFAAPTSTVTTFNGQVEITNVKKEVRYSGDAEYGGVIGKMHELLELELGLEDADLVHDGYYEAYVVGAPATITVKKAAYDDYYGVLWYSVYAETKDKRPNYAMNEYTKGAWDYNYELQDRTAYEGTITLEKPGVYHVYFSNGSDASSDAAISIYFVVEDTAPTTPTPAQPKPNATPTTSTVLVNNQPTTFEAYTIDGNNYFKLRDLAQVVNGTEKNFEVEWDGVKNAINLKSNAPYTPAGGELAKGDNKAKNATQSTSVIYKDGEAINLKAYTINGNNFFKLRDIAQAFDIGVTWDNATKTVGIDTSIGYTAE